MNKDVAELSEAMHYLDKALTILGAIRSNRYDKEQMTLADVIEELRAKQ